MNPDFFKWTGWLLLLYSAIHALGQLPRFRGRFYDGSASLARRLVPTLLFGALGLAFLMGYRMNALTLFLFIMVFEGARYMISRRAQRGNRSGGV